MKNQEKLTKKEMQIELDRCKNGYNGMTGEEYFFYNYCRIDGKLPDPNSYTKERFRAYQETVKQQREYAKIKMRRPGFRSFSLISNAFSMPLIPTEAELKKPE